MPATDRPSWSTTSADGTRIAVHELGGEGEIVLIAHATGFLGAVYEPMAAELTDRFRVVALDCRGHGDSGLPASRDLDWQSMSADVAAVAAALAPGPIHFFGHSMGGAVGLLVERDRPGTFASVFAYEPIVFPSELAALPPGTNPLAVGARARRPSFASRDEALRRYISRPPLDKFRADVLHRYVEHGFADQPDGTVALKCAPSVEADVFEASGIITTAALSGLAAPTVVAVGHPEPGPNPAAFAPVLVTVLANARLLTFDHVGHFGPFQDPVSVAAAVRAHADAVSSR